MAAYNDNELLQRLLDVGTRREAFADLVRLYSEPLYWKIRRMVFSHEDTDDILQNVFIKAWSSIDSFQSRSKLSTWLYRIAINEALDYIRRQKCRIVAASADDDLTLANRLMADDNFDGDRAEALLQQAIAQLPEVQRAVFTLRYYDEMKYSDISQLLHTSEGALKASYHIAVKKITDFFNEND